MFKLDSLHRMLPRGSRRNKKTLENDSAHRPAETICSSECDSFTPSISRRVCFDEDENSYYDNDFAFEDYESVWYTKDDFSFFNQENKALIKCLRQAETETSDHEFWTRSLGRLYWAFQDATNPKALQPLLESTKVTLDDEVIGTEKSVIRAIAREHLNRLPALVFLSALIRDASDMLLEPPATAFEHIEKPHDATTTRLNGRAAQRDAAPQPNRRA